MGRDGGRVPGRAAVPGGGGSWPRPGRTQPGRPQWLPRYRYIQIHGLHIYIHT